MKAFSGGPATCALLVAALACWTSIAGRAAFTTGNLAVFSADAASTNNTTFTILELSTSLPNQSSPVNSIAINGTSGGSALRTSGSAVSPGYLANSDDGRLLVFTGHNTTNILGNINAVRVRGVGTLDHDGVFALRTTYLGISGNQTRGAGSVNNSLWWVGDQGGLYTNNTALTFRSGNYRSVKSFGGNLYVLVASAFYPPVLALGTSPVATNGLPGLPVGDSDMQDFYLISSGNNGSSFDVLYILNASSFSAGTIYKYSLVNGSWTANGSHATLFGGFGLCAARNGGGAVLYLTTGTGATAANSVIQLTDTAGHNATINIATGSNVTLYTAAAGTTMKGIAFAPSCAAPLAAVRSADSTAICPGGSATIHADLAGTGPWTVTWSDSTVQSGVAASPATRTVSPGSTTVYTVTAVTDQTGCTPGVSSGSATITVISPPASTITAASSVCPNSTNNTAFVANAGAGASYGWTISGGSIMAGSATNIITYAVSASGTVVLGCAVTNSAGCYSNASSATVAISATVTTAAGNSGPYCVGGTISLTASGEVGDTYSWTGPNGFTSTVQNPLIASATMANAGDYTVTRSTACGTSAPSTTTVAVNPVPGSTITASLAVCGGSTGNVASVPDAGAGASYGWTITGGSITAGSGTAAITYTAGPSGTAALGCTVTNSAGCSNAGFLNVTINPVPDSTVTSAGSTYSGSTNNTASVPDAGVGAAYAWTINGGTISAGGGTRSVTFTAGTPGTLTLGCTVTANTGCSSVSSADVAVHLAFTTRNLAVVRIGDGSASLTPAGTPVFVDEYSTAGVLRQSIAVPATGNRALVNSGTASSEGALMRSPNGSLLCFAGYHADAGTAGIASTVASSIPRVVGTLNGGGTFELSASTTTQFSGDNIRSAATDGAHDFWAAGDSSGTYYLGTASAPATVQNAVTSTRVISVFNGNLCFTVGSGMARGLYGFNGLPVAAASATHLIDGGSTSSPFGFAVNAAGTVAYIADESSVLFGGGIQKWTKTAGTWSLAYVLTNAGTGSRSLTVDFSQTHPLIYATTTESSTNRLVAITDTGSVASATTLATAAPNTVFRGVAFAPEAAPVITRPPEDQSACSGTTASFDSVAEGAATLVPQWQVSTDNGASFSDINGANSAGYSLLVTNGDHGKRFRVIYSNSYGAVTSAVATLTASSATASDFSLSAHQGAPFRIAEAVLLAHASGSSVTLASIDATSANGVSLTRTNGEIFYNGTLAANDSFHYTVACGTSTASALATIVANTGISPVSIGIANGIPILNFTGIAGFSYTVQRSTNLTTWEDLLTTNAPAGSGRFDYQDLAAPQPAAFYRLRYNP